MAKILHGRFQYRGTGIHFLRAAVDHWHRKACHVGAHLQEAEVGLAKFHVAGEQQIRDLERWRV